MNLEVEVVPFDGHLSRADFDCGNEELNNWLRTYARQNQERGISRTFLAIPKKGTLSIWHDAGFKDIEDTTILGFFSLSAAQVPIAHLPPNTKLPRSIPVVRMGRLAVHRLVQRKGFGEMLLMEAIARAAQVSGVIGVSGLFVDAKDSNAAAFYAKNGFLPSEDDPLKLWLPLNSIVQLLSGESS